MSILQATKDQLRPSVSLRSSSGAAKANGSTQIPGNRSLPRELGRIPLYVSPPRTAGLP